jgi:cholesterol oxidase
VSKRLGCHFSGNGDLLGFAYDVDQPAHSVGLGHRPPPPPGRAVGPTITGMIDLRHRRRPEEGLLIEDGAMPGPVGSLLPAAFAMAAPFIGAPASRTALDSLRRSVREPAGVLAGPHRGPLDRTFAYLVMSGDDHEGSLLLRDDRLRVRWRGVGDRPVVRHHNHTLAQATRALRGTYVPDPLWTGAFGHALITVHPLGGCIMADDGENGVVDYRGRVFSGGQGAKPYRGLYVADGSIVPVPLGVNPLLTISALAEWICEEIVRNSPSP